MKNSAAVMIAVVGVLSWATCTRSPVDDRMAEQRPLPRAMFITTGLNYGNGTLAEGVTAALQSLNRFGIPVRLENREALFDSSRLAGYDIIIALTASGYHDADRKHSLIYLSDEEIHQLERWVYNGGCLVAGDNIGRYFLDGTDRAVFTRGRLSPENWGLGACFGVTLQEMHLQGYAMKGNVSGDTARSWRCQPQDRWRMVPVERYPATEVAAWWYRDTVVYPAITRYNYGRGRAVLLSSSYLLHPANGGGWLGAADIDDFYEELVVTLTRPRDSGMALSLHPWPNAAPYALCVTLDAEGTLPAFENAVNLLQGLGVSPVFYVNAHLDPGVAAAVRDRGFTLHSKGFDPVYAGAQDCHGIRLNILRNELHWRTRFTGYRFPQGFPSFLGLQALCRLGYVFDNSVAVDNVDELKGSVVPYNLPLNNTGFEVPPPPASLYLSSDLLEISPIQKDDYYFFRRLVNADDYPAGLMRRDAEVYTRHLQTFLRTAVKPYRGVASYVGRVSNTGHNETTLQPLREMVRTALRDTAWIAPIDSIAWYRNKIGSLRLTVREKERIVEISMQVRGSGEVPGLTLRVAARPAALSVVEGPAKLLRRDDAWYVVCTGSDRQIVTLRF